MRTAQVAAESFRVLAPKAAEDDASPSISLYRTSYEPRV